MFRHTLSASIKVNSRTEQLFFTVQNAIKTNKKIKPILKTKCVHFWSKKMFLVGRLQLFNFL